MMAAATALSCEAIFRLALPELANSLLRVIVSAYHAIDAPRISDHWKERAVAAYAGRLFSASLRLIGSILIILAPFILLAIGINITPMEAGAVFEWPGVLFATVFALSYLLLRARWAGSAGQARRYGPMSQMLHELALASPHMGRRLFSLEDRFFSPKPAKDGKHVFIIGLARAGTTILMRRLYETGQFASLTYRDMPLVFAPNLWRALTPMAARNVAEQERAHGDGIWIGLDSPEALEEPFWRSFAGGDYITQTALRPHSAADKLTQTYRRYVGFILRRYDKARYLSKNNNGSLRLATIGRAFPFALVLAPFRRPEDQVRSLLRQHRRFLKDEDPFTKRYMQWLVHHEFGQDRRPYAFEAGPAEKGVRPDDAWLHQWIVVYARILDAIRSGEDVDIIPVCYEDLCDSRIGLWERLCRVVEIAPSAARFEPAPTADCDLDVTPSLLRKAEDIYQSLRRESEIRLGAALDRSPRF